MSSIQNLAPPTAHPATGRDLAGWDALPPEYRIPSAPPSVEEARLYCERLAKSHYENFSVATWFLLPGLRQHFYNVYAFCRIADDLGDEVDDPQLSLQLLNLWEAELEACYAGAPRHPVFVALKETVHLFSIERQTFADLLIAFRQDQRVARYETFDDVLDYCRYSANPVGHLVLNLAGHHDPQRYSLSDFTCTALQLANFWQDVSRDFAKGRIYLPLEDLRRFGVKEEELGGTRATPQFGELMKFEVQRARHLFEQGLPLVKMVDKTLAIDIELFSRGGQEVLHAIERQGFDVLRKRPAISKPRKLALMLRAFAGKLL